MRGALVASGNLSIPLLPAGGEKVREAGMRGLSSDSNRAISTGPSILSRNRKAVSTTSATFSP